MNMRFCRTFAVVAGMACAVSSVFAAEAEVITITAEMSPYLMGGSGLDAKNKAGKIYDLQEGAELCMTNSAGCWRIWTNVIATNGLAFVSSTDANANSTLELRGTLITGGEGRLGVKNFNKFITYVDFGSDATTSAYPGDCFFDGAGFFFADADGNSRTGGKIFLEGGAVKSVPTDPNVQLTWGDPDGFAHIVIAPGSQWKDLGEFTFAASECPYALYVADDTSLKPGATVNVAAACAFGVAAGEVSNSLNPFALTYRTTGNAFTNSFHVVLGEGSTFAAASRVTDVSLGTIEGPGGVTCCCVKKDRPANESYITSKFLGQNLYTGVTKIAGAYQRAEFGASVPTGNFACDAYTYTQFSFYPAEHEDGGNSAVTINRLDAPYLANQIMAASNQTVTVKKIVGKCSAYPLLGDETSVVDFNPAIGPAVIRTNSRPNVHFNGKPSAEAGVVNLYKSNAGEILILLPDENGEGTPWEECSTGQLWVNRPWLDVGDSQTFATQPTYAPLRAKNGTLTLKTGGQPVKTIVGPNATAKVEYTGNWKETAALWLDPDTSKLYYQGELALQEWKDKVINSGGSIPSFTKNGTAGPYIEGLMDCRGEETHGEYMAFNDRDYDGVGGNPPKMENIGYMTHAQLATRADGLKYIDCHSISGARLPLHKGGKDAIRINNEPAFAATMAIFVINSANGGGAAVIGTQNASYARTKSATGPITSNPVQGDIWLDGKKVADPTVTCLNGGWQILSIDVSKYPISGFGWDKRRSNNGGVDYGDIILFTNDLSAVERQAAEKYLAKKWGISTYAPDTAETFEMEISGSGAAELPAVGEIEVRGAFRGTATVAADSVVTIKNDLPWTEKDIPTDGLLNWFDPNDAASFELRTEEGDDIVFGFCDRGKTFDDLDENAKFLYGVSSRKPFRRTWQRGCGPLLSWIDFEHAPDHVAGSSDGNTLRLKNWHKDMGINGSDYNGNKGDGADTTVAGRTFFAVSDSFRGGGDVLRQAVGSAGAFGTRDTCAVIDNGIWKNAGDEVLNGTTRLNGTAVATPKNTGFTGEPEVLSLCTETAPVAFGCIGNYGNTESQTDPVTGKKFAIPRFGYGEMVGEVLVYDKQLDDTVRANIEDYLMSKWIGYSPAGKTDWRGATVDGAGTVKAATLGIAPKMASTFAGTLALIESEAAPTYEATVTADGVTGGLVAPEATVTHNWSGNPKLNVTVSGQKVYGEFTLVSLKAISPTVTWDVVVTSKKGLAEVVQSDGGATVKVNIVPRGTMILIR